MSEETRQRVLEKGASLIRKYGFNNTGINEVLKAAGVPKGSFYYYFESKEDFGLQLIEYLHKGIRKGFYGYLAEEDYGDTQPLERLRQFFDYFRKTFTSEDEKCGCPIGNISQELAATNPRFREKLDEVFNDVVAPVSICLARAVEAGELPEETDALELAEFIVNSWQGALIFVKVRDGGRPLELFEKYIFDVLLPRFAPLRTPDPSDRRVVRV